MPKVGKLNFEIIPKLALSNKIMKMHFFVLQGILSTSIIMELEHKNVFVLAAMVRNSLSISAYTSNKNTWEYI